MLFFLLLFTHDLIQMFLNDFFSSPKNHQKLGQQFSFFHFLPMFEPDTLQNYEQIYLFKNTLIIQNHLGNLSSISLDFSLGTDSFTRQVIHNPVIFQ